MPRAKAGNTIAWNVAAGLSGLQTVGLFALQGYELMADTHEVVEAEQENVAVLAASLVAISLILGVYIVGKIAIRAMFWFCNLVLSGLNKSPCPTGIPRGWKDVRPKTTWSNEIAWLISGLTGAVAAGGAFVWKGYNGTTNWHNKTLEYVGSDFEGIADTMASLYAVAFVLFFFLGGKYSTRILLWIGNLALSQLGRSPCPTKIPKMRDDTDSDDSLSSESESDDEEEDYLIRLSKIPPGTFSQ